jgi:MFS family permease
MNQLQRKAWLVFALIALANYGNYYVYDSIGSVADLLQRQRSFSDSQIGMLNAIYSLPNIVLVLLGGILVDRFGSARMTMWTGAVCLAGALLTALSPGFTGMVAGRLLFGIGGANLVAGWLNDFYGASALNPAGYQPMMLYFLISGALGFAFAMMLWVTAGRRHHETVTHAK